MEKEVKKIVIIGPESTGKSMLCEKLASHFNTLWVPEYAREYLIANGNNYTIEDLQKIAKGQIANEEKKLEELINTKQESNLLFVDTDLYVMKVWSEYVFNCCDNSILNGIVNRNYDLYLLCEPDIPWVKDELREYPDLKTREQLYHYYKDAMLNQSCRWKNINGNYETRLQQAIEAITPLL